MFYSPVYLKKSGRFGLIWIAATQTKILSRREIAAVNISRICSDLFCHIPGLKEKGSKASRFSLYLCCQLMYGSVKVLQKQWDILLVDVQSLCKRCTDAPSSTKDIDMAIGRQAVCLESNIPSDEKDVNFDPYFGAVKEPIIDVASMLEYLESLSQSKMLVVEPFPLPVQPEVGSPHSVSDPREIQILDVSEIAPIDAQLPMEQDLPRMDMDSFLSISQEGSLLEIQAQIEGSRSEQERHDHLPQDLNIPEQQQMSLDGALQTDDPNVRMMREILMDSFPQGEREQIPLLEETPMTKPGSGMPPPPHKPRLDRPRKPRDATRKGSSRFQDICNEAEMQANTQTNDGQAAELTSSGDSLQPEQQNRDQIETDERGHGHDWAQKNPLKLDLHPLSPVASPLRKKRPHKLVVDECLMISRPELRAHMEDTSDIVMQLPLPDTAGTGNFYKEPGLKYMRNKALMALFSRNRKFGLRSDDTGSEPDSITSPQPPRLADFLSRKRARKEAADEETPAKKIPRSSSEVASMEKARVSEGLSASVEKNLSHSSLGQVGDESAQHTRSRSRGHLSFPSDLEVSKDGSSVLEHDVTLDLGVLAPLVEEQELKISPIRGPRENSSNGKNQSVEEVQVTLPKSSVPQDTAGPAVAETIITTLPKDVTTIMNNTDMDSHFVTLTDTPRTSVFKLVESNMRTSNDWTTFQNICPTTSCTKKTAASMFSALCAQIARGKLCARQDNPYTTIFIWIPEFTSGLSTTTESHSA